MNKLDQKVIKNQSLTTRVRIVLATIYFEEDPVLTPGLCRARQQQDNEVNFA